MLKKFLKITLIASLPVFMASCGNEETGSTTEITDDSESTEEADPSEDDSMEEDTTAVVDESTEENGTDLSFEEGTWAYTVQSFINGSGPGTQTFTLDQIVLSDEEGDESVTVEAEKQLDELASLLKSKPGIEAEIQGHSKEANNAATKALKKGWSKAKALFFRKKLENKGVSADQLRHEGFGDKNLIEGIDGKDAKQNRIMVKLTRK